MSHGQPAQPAAEGASHDAQVRGAASGQRSLADRLAAVAAPLLVALVAFWSHADLLELGWLGEDSITLAHASRWDDGAGVVQQLTHEYMHGGGFQRHYYRPLTSLLVGWEAARHGPDGRAYQLGNLLVIVALSVAVYALALLLPRRAAPRWWLRLSAVGAALVFSQHPVVHVVAPVLSRRGECLMVLAGTAALAWALHARRRHGSTVSLSVAVLCLAASVASKEAGLVLLAPLAVIWSWRSASRTPRSWWLPGGALLLSVTAYLALRQALLSSDGGVGASAAPSAAAALRHVSRSLLATLLVPVRFSGTGLAATWLPGLVLLLGVAGLCQGLADLALGGRRARERACLLGGVALATAALAWSLTGRDGLVLPEGAPIEARWRAEAATLGGPLSVGLALACALAAWAWLRRLRLDTPRDSRDSALLLLAWILGQWCCLALSGASAARNALGPAVALALLLLLGVDAARAALGRPRSPRAAASTLLGGLTCLALAASLVLGTLALRHERGWQRLDGLLAPYLDGVADALRAHRPTRVTLTGAPRRLPAGDDLPSCLALPGLREHTLTAWVHWQLDAAVDVTVLDQVVPPASGRPPTLTATFDATTGSLRLDAAYDD